MQHLFRSVPAVVVPVHDHALVIDRDIVIPPVFRRFQICVPQLAFQLRILLFQPVIVFDPDIEQVFAVLDIRDPRFPEQIQHIDFCDRDIPDAVHLCLVPADVVRSRAFQHLLPVAFGIGFFKPVDLQHDRDDLAEDLCFRLVLFHPRQDDRFRITVHRVRVLAADAIPQPCRRALVRLRSFRPALVLDLAPVAQLPPVLAVNDPPVYAGLPGLVAHQQLFCFDDSFLCHPLRRFLRSFRYGRHLCDGLRAHPRAQLICRFRVLIPDRADLRICRVYHPLQSSCFLVQLHIQRIPQLQHAHLPRYLRV